MKVPCTRRLKPLPQAAQCRRMKSACRCSAWVELLSSPACTWKTCQRSGWRSSSTMLPACDLSTREPLAPGRKLLDAGATLAIASNLNPGTSYTSSMNYCVTTAVLQQHLSVDEAIHAATTGGATALRRHNVGNGLDPQGRPAKGTIVEGAAADLHVLDAPSAVHLAYRPGMPLSYRTFVAGA